MQTNYYRYKIRIKIQNMFLFAFYLDNAPSELIVQADHIHLFDDINVNTCDETCNVEDIVGTVELHTNGLDSGCNLEQCCTYC